MYFASPWSRNRRWFPQLHEAHLGDLVARPDRLLAGAERAIEQCRTPERDVEQLAAARRLVVGDGGFVQVPGVVQLVTVDLFLGPPRRARPVVGMLGIDGARRVEVSVGLLRTTDGLDEASEVRLHLLVGTDAERVRRPLHDLVQVGVVERVLGRRAVGGRVSREHGAKPAPGSRRARSLRTS